MTRGAAISMALLAIIVLAADRATCLADAQRLGGHGHARALRSVGDRLLNVACAMLRNGTQFNPSLESQKNAC